MRGEAVLHRDDRVKRYVEAVADGSNGDLFVLGAWSRAALPPAPLAAAAALVASGQVEAHIREQDLAYGWLNYWSMDDALELAPHPGSMCTGHPLELEGQVEEHAFRRWLARLALGPGPYGGGLQDPARVEEYLGAFLRALDGGERCERWLLQTGALHHADPDTGAHPEGGLAVFEPRSDCNAWVVSVSEERLTMLLVAPYPCRIATRAPGVLPEG